ncbi:MAG TPA: alginate export family protein [Methylomirabilota bacterium]|nr:alginate export family protein [Methylomirabilota bacterium]
MTRPLTRRGIGHRLPPLMAILLATMPAFSAKAADDVFDPDEPPETKYQIAPFLTFGAEIEVVYEYRKNLGLDDRPDNDAAVLEPELSLALSFDPDPRFQAFLNVAVTRLSVLKIEADQSKPSEDVTVELKEAFVWLRSLPGGFSLQVGRQRFEDERQWLYDEELDAVRLRFEHAALAIELSASRDGLVRKDLFSSTQQRERINNYMLLASYRLPRDTTLEAYAIVRDDQDADRRPVFAGLRARGEPIEDLDYWLELAYAGGREGSKRIRGWGVDLGATYEFQVGPKPALTLGFAFGSGDKNPDDDTDESFRQTGLQDNEGDFGGATDFKYYGEVLDPELSNLGIITAGLGIRPSDKFSVDLVYHYYFQHRAAPTLRNAGIDAEPSGRSRRLGSGIDLVFGLQEIWDHVDARFGVGYFLPGAAFPGSVGGAWVVGVEVQFRF